MDFTDCSCQKTRILTHTQRLSTIHLSRDGDDDDDDDDDDDGDDDDDDDGDDIDDDGYDNDDGDDDDCDDDDDDDNDDDDDDDDDNTCINHYDDTTILRIMMNTNSLNYVGIYVCQFRIRMFPCCCIKCSDRYVG